MRITCSRTVLARQITWLRNLYWRSLIAKKLIFGQQVVSCTLCSAAWWRSTARLGKSFINKFARRHQIWSQVNSGKFREVARSSCCSCFTGIRIEDLRQNNCWNTNGCRRTPKWAKKLRKIFKFIPLTSSNSTWHPTSRRWSSPWSSAWESKKKSCRI